jgi:predicted Zn-dependent peptidase
MSATVPAASSASVIESARAVLRSLSSAAPSVSETENARREALNSNNVQPGNRYSFADIWLDSITYKYDASTDARALDDVTPADIQRVAARLFGDGQFATVVVGDATELQAALVNLQGGVEVAGAQANKPATTQPPSQPAPRRP